MSKDKAIAWAVTVCREALELEYFTALSEAVTAQQAMETLTGLPWKISTHGKDRHWVKPQ